MLLTILAVMATVTAILHTALVVLSNMMRSDTGPFTGILSIVFVWAVSIALWLA